MGLVGSLCLLRGEKKLLLEKENLGSLLKSKSTWSPASVLNLKMWIRFLNFWNLTFQNEKMDGKWTDSPLRNTTPLKSKNFDLPQKYKKPKFQLPLPPFPPNFSGGCTLWHLYLELLVKTTDALNACSFARVYDGQKERNFCDHYNLHIFKIQ